MKPPLETLDPLTRAPLYSMAFALCPQKIALFMRRCSHQMKTNIGDLIIGRCAY